MHKIPTLAINHASIPWEDLDGQFIIGQGDFLVPPFWKTSTLGGIKVATELRLPTTTVALKGQPVALFLGWPIHPEWGSLNQLDNLGGHVTHLDHHPDFEKFLNCLSGRFVALYAQGQDSRFYLDAAGSMAAVYCPSQQLLASTPLLIPQTPDTALDADLVETFGIPYRDAWYPFGLTNRSGIHRLLPNHYLELATWTAVRHWPLANIPETTDIDLAVEEIADLLKRCIKHAVAAHGGLLALTAGRDSRMLLACARKYIGAIRVFTAECDWAGYNGAVDIDTAQHISKKLHINHTVLPFQLPSQRDYQMWLHRTGNCVGEVFGLRNIRTMNLLDKMDGVYLCGGAAEVGRCYYWHKSDLRRTDIDIQTLLRRMHVPAISQVVSAGERWLAGLPQGNAVQTLDLAYLEQRLGCWAGAVSYADIPLKRVHPFAQRRIFELMLGLPKEFRFKQALAERVIALEWSDLLAFPFNKPIGLKVRLWQQWLRIKRLCRRRVSQLLSRTPFLWRYNPGR